MSSATGTQRHTSGAPATPSIRSLLAVDCGSAFTKVALLGLVDGRHRLLCVSQTPTTAMPPYGDVMRGMLTAIGDVERISARQLVRDGRLLMPEQEAGDGVDAVVVAISAGGPLRLLTAGPARDALASLVHRGIGGLFTALEPFPADVMAPRDDAVSPEWERHMARLWALRPHAVLVVGHSLEGQRGRPDIDETGRAIAAWMEGARGQGGESTPRPEVPVVFAGLPAEGKLLRDALGGRAEPQVLDPLTPTTLAPLSRAVAGLYESAVLRAVPGYDRVRAISSVPPTSVATSLAGAVRFLGQHYQMNVVGVDVGASSTALVGATAQGNVLPAMQPEAGVGLGLGAILRATGAASVLRWVAEPVEETELRDYVLQRMLRPGLLPSTPRELEIEHAFAREAIMLALRAPGSMLGGLQPLDVLLGTGGVLAHTPRHAQAAMILLDALQPKGITSLVLDVAQLAGMLGELGVLDAGIGGQIAEGDAVVAQLGSVVSTFGAVPEGQPAVRVSLEYGDGRRHVVDVMQGTIVRLPLHTGERALLSLFPAPTVDVGLGPGQHARASDPLDGGLLGLIVDARGRPLALPAGAEERRARLREWRAAMGITA